MRIELHNSGSPRLRLPFSTFCFGCAICWGSLHRIRKGPRGYLPNQEEIGWPGTDVELMTEMLLPDSLHAYTLGKSSAFSSRIAAEAAGMKKGEISGTAVLDNEDFICFKDGSISFVVDDELSHQPYACKTDYWCPSILV